MAKKPPPKLKVSPKVARKTKAHRKSPAGRKSLYLPDYAEEAYRLCLLGARDIDLAGCFGVHVDTIQEWKKVHPEFSDAIARGKHRADSHIACALYERAKGAEWKEEMAVKYKTGKGTQEAVRVITVTRRAPPDTQACVFWLKNRQRKAWKDKVDYVQLNDKKADEPQRVTFKMDRDIEQEEKDC